MVETLYTRKEAAKMLRISLDVLDKARSTGELKFVQYVEHGNVYFKEEQLEEYVAHCTHCARPADQLPTIRKRRAACRPRG